MQPFKLTCEKAKRAHGQREATADALLSADFFFARLPLVEAVGLRAFFLMRLVEHDAAMAEIEAARRKGV